MKYIYLTEILVDSDKGATEAPIALNPAHIAMIQKRKLERTGQDKYLVGQEPPPDMTVITLINGRAANVKESVEDILKIIQKE